MKRILFYVLVCSWLFSFVDWKVIHATRWADRTWLDWMHAHEKMYNALTTYPELILCAPCVALKPIFMESFKRVEASQEEQDAITHAPLPDARGFYKLMRRGESWTFVPWLAWALYWLPPILVWVLLARRFF